MRKEKDSMGEVFVPDDAYYGAQTQRAAENFPISNRRIPRTLIKSLAMIKKSAAIVNHKLSRLNDEIKDAIVSACDEVIGGEHDSQFIVDIFQTGSGTSSNMNINEVLSNRANEILGHELGDKFPVHPNDHVNLGQSSNDTFPSAINLSISLDVDSNLLPALNELLKSLNMKTEEFSNIIKIGRTHLQDATPLTLGQEFSGYAQMIQNSIYKIEDSLKYIHYLAQGGTAVGTGINTHPDFGKMIAKELSKDSGISFNEAVNHFEAQSTQDSVLTTSSALRGLAVSLSKIANDIRFLGSGPRAGIGELNIPAVQPGSSIMPGKVNPVICESLIQVCAQVIGNDQSVIQGAQGSYFELNVMMPMIASNILESINILSTSIDMFNKKLIVDLEANKEICNGYIEGSLAMCTSLVPAIGYDKAAEIAYKAYQQNKTVREIALNENILSKEEIDKLLNHENMIKSK
ncbi:MAG: aspartate ammonia-lyase [Candidatus Marinimicrobia bacterium]|nr:aspartate ammonia-lyase [Candidatus Neomarinimicrobiota bacterium]|tara:strand:- start:8108 stop:9490 length:1383 start_codon:yes stop_codon:yes gene_type:complete